MIDAADALGALPSPRAADDPNPFIRALARLVADGRGTWQATTRELRADVARVLPSLRLEALGDVAALRSVLAANEVIFGRNLRKWIPAIEDAGLAIRRVRRYRRHGLPGSTDERVWVITSREVLDDPAPAALAAAVSEAVTAAGDGDAASADRRRDPTAYPRLIVVVTAALSAGMVAAMAATFFVGR